MEILYEDKHLIVAVKPVGLLSQSGGGDKESFADAVSLYLKEKGETGEIFVLHRLDRAVGGVIVYAKTKYAASEISKQITNGDFQKEYIAAVHGVPESKSGIYEDLLFKDSRKNKSFVVKRMRKGVKTAKLSYEVLKESENDSDKTSLIKVKLHTGRTHQIRVQFSSRKMPLIGDGKYGGSDNCNIGLWSYSVEFVHPKTKEKLKFEINPEGKQFVLNNVEIVKSE